MKFEVQVHRNPYLQPSPRRLSGRPRAERVGPARGPLGDVSVRDRGGPQLPHGSFQQSLFKPDYLFKTFIISILSASRSSLKGARSLGARCSKKKKSILSAENRDFSQIYFNFSRHCSPSTAARIGRMNPRVA